MSAGIDEDPLLLKMKKKKLLRIISSLNPRYGGASKGVADSSVALTKQGFIVDILTTDNFSDNFLKSKKINVINLGPKIFGYFSLKTFFWLKKNKDKYDHFIVEGIWEFNTLIARLLIKDKFYVYTHGQLDPFFGTQFLKKIKKQIYWFLIEKRNLMAAKSLLLTTAKEKKLLRKTFVNTEGIKKTIVGYGILKENFDKKKVLNKFYSKFSYFKNKKFFLFLGRFHEKKGIEILLENVKLLKEQKIDINILMAGPASNLKSKLIERSKKYNLQKNIYWTGMLLGDLKWGALSASEAMVLSSHGENFGVAVVESLSCGKPVLISNKVNIYDKVKKYKAGFVSHNSTKSFLLILKLFLNLGQKNKNILSINAYKCFQKNFNLMRDNNLSKIIRQDNEK